MGLEYLFSNQFNFGRGKGNASNNRIPNSLFILTGLIGEFIKFDFTNLKLINMFGDMMGMMNKLKEAQEKVEATKGRLNSVLVDEESNDGLLKVTITANREIKNISVADELLEDKEQLEDYLVLTLNKAIEKATKINEAEISAAAKDGMPDIPGMNDMLK